MRDGGPTVVQYTQCLCANFNPVLRYRFQDVGLSHDVVELAAVGVGGGGRRETVAADGLRARRRVAGGRQVVARRRHVSRRPSRGVRRQFIVVANAPPANTTPPHHNTPCHRIRIIRVLFLTIKYV